MGKKNKNKNKAQNAEKVEEPVDDAKMAGSGDEEGKSGDTSESDVKMQEENGTIGPVLPPGFDDAMNDEKAEEKKEEEELPEPDEKMERNPTGIEPAAEAPKDEKAEEKVEEEKKDSEKDSEESKSTEDSGNSTEPGYASQAFSGVKRLGGNALGMLQSLMGSQGTNQMTMPTPPKDGVYD